ncbi:hypothetical protein FGG36_gp17 [Mycobacterium phage Jeffabunny]|uniref:Uncharacterized protein n=5 Tax=Gladiatorvirus TaxID=2948726 RepID=G8IC74_9CAUD|nr:hypothetical protein X820_gp016 [Mycobacterium phage CloudWang3]YP_008858522.1 hypothetical protein X828_gp016 [Mycobacterium phage Artemis2UCLA]YP_009637898.1 hypothetical protein FGG32_gp015 [Mycobacterium phage EricB]YP_009638258.1 hypothetical protein FGG36_gp17 [Mycobacterium phage Jeffabunny]YP_010061320.1 hypothetical protein KIP55_gp014 [Mycobacterium phage Priamo]YP_010061422.1 hypothetical protein KIP56_gp014 [Mycobacterium phage Koko]AOT24831.1 hypothetical protein PBI_ISIPHIWO_
MPHKEWCQLYSDHTGDCQDFADIFWWGDDKHHETEGI